MLTEMTGGIKMCSLLLNNNIVPKFVVILIWDALWAFAYVSQVTFIELLNCSYHLIKANIAKN